MNQKRFRRLYRGRVWLELTFEDMESENPMLSFPRREADRKNK